MTAKINQKYVYGIHSVTSVIKSDNESIIKVYFKKQANSKNLKILQNLALENSLLIEEIDTDKLTLMSGSTKHQGVVCQLSIDNLSSFNLNTFLQLAENPLILILDSIKDPGNLGACIRTANAAGCQLVIKRKSNSSPITAAVHKSSCGGTSNIYIYETNTKIFIIHFDWYNHFCIIKS